jgi:hypothetical protein
MSRHALAQTWVEAAQSFIGFISGYFPHAAPQASQASAQAWQMADISGPCRPQIRAAVAQISPQSSASAFVFTCSFMPERIIEAQWLEQARQLIAHVAHAFAQAA